MKQPLIKDLQEQVSRRFEQIPAYVPIEPFEVIAERVGRSAEQIIKLDANENPYGLAPQAKKALADLRWGNIYPDPESRALRQAIAAYMGVPVEHIVAGAGADELIDLILRVILRPNDSVLVAPPTFGMYAFDARINGGQVLEIPRNRDFSLNLEEMRRVVRDNKPSAILLASPNNPDGGMLTPLELEEILGWGILVVLDEAYIEFSDGGQLGEQASQIHQPLKRDNLVVLRTFSKWAGLAGLRVGFGVFPQWMLPVLWKVKQPYNVSVAASAAAIASLQDLSCLIERVQKIRSERVRLYQLLAQINWLEPIPSQANFILCRVKGRSAKAVKAELMKKGIFVRYFDTPLLQNFIRVSVGLPQHHDVLFQALKEMEEEHL
ncbi:MAG: histidinol-phosphate transaminase [Chloroflexota bacterium]